MRKRQLIYLTHSQKCQGMAGQVVPQRLLGVHDSQGCHQLTHPGMICNPPRVYRNSIHSDLENRKISRSIRILTK